MSIESETSPRLSRREVLRQFTLIFGAGLASTALTACGANPSSEHSTPGEAKPQPAPTAAHESPSPEKHETAKYPEHKVMATIFHIGEKASKDNAGIDNISTAWETDAVKYLGGVDDPEKRNPDGLPDFTPKENPFYFALPASEFDENGLIKGAREASPWAKEAAALPRDDSRSLFKGRWIKVSLPGSDEVVYGQWLDTGPSDDPRGARDYGYVFGDGSQKPKNTFGLKAGIDLSPAMAAQLGFSVQDGGTEVVWQFVDRQDVPDGLWKKFPDITNKTHWD